MAIQATLLLSSHGNVSRAPMAPIKKQLIYGQIISQDVYNPATPLQQDTANAIAERFGNRYYPVVKVSKHSAQCLLPEFIQEELHEKGLLCNRAIQKNSLQEFKQRARDHGYDFGFFSRQGKELIRYVVISNVNPGRFTAGVRLSNFLLGTLRRLLIVPDALGHDFSMRAAPLDENTVIYQETYRNGWKSVPLPILNKDELPPPPQLPPAETQPPES
jgi:hypothetical protein